MPDAAKPGIGVIMKNKAYLILVPLAAMWAVELANLAMDHRLVEWGILPRTVSGLMGIPLSPFIHGSASHALSNSIPFVVLGGAVLMQGVRRYIVLSLLVVFGGGGIVWLVARASFHVGASGVVFGYFGYLLARGWYEHTFKSILIAIVALVLYGGVLLGLAPTSSEIAWEGHLAGFLVGILGARMMRSRPERSVGRPARAAEL